MEKRRVAVLLLALPLLSGCGLIFEEKLPRHASTPDARRAVAEDIISFWANPSAFEARRLIEEYGPPDEANTGSLVWNNKGPWLRATVWDQAPAYVAADEKDVVRQDVMYPVAGRNIGDLRAFSDKIVIGDDLTTLGVRANDEQVGFLTLNLAHEIAQGRKTVAQAKEDYQKILRLRDSGKSSPYLAGLLFRF